MKAPTNAWTPQEALLEIYAGAGGHFDPLVVEGFAKVLERPYSSNCKPCSSTKP